jgi:hypothetical protein
MNQANPLFVAMLCIFSFTFHNASAFLLENFDFIEQNAKTLTVMHDSEYVQTEFVTWNSMPLKVKMVRFDITQGTVVAKIRLYVSDSLNRQYKIKILSPAPDTMYQSDSLKLNSFNDISFAFSGAIHLDTLTMMFYTESAPVDTVIEKANIDFTFPSNACFHPELNNYFIQGSWRRVSLYHNPYDYYNEDTAYLIIDNDYIKKYDKNYRLLSQETYDLYGCDLYTKVPIVSPTKINISVSDSFFIIEEPSGRYTSPYLVIDQYKRIDPINLPTKAIDIMTKTQKTQACIDEYFYNTKGQRMRLKSMNNRSDILHHGIYIKKNPNSGLYEKTFILKNCLR